MMGPAITIATTIPISVKMEVEMLEPMDAVPLP